MEQPHLPDLPPDKHVAWANESLRYIAALERWAPDLIQGVANDFAKRGDKRRIAKAGRRLLATMPDIISQDLAKMLFKKVGKSFGVKLEERTTAGAVLLANEVASYQSYDDLPKESEFLITTMAGFLALSGFAKAAGFDKSELRAATDRFVVNAIRAYKGANIEVGLVREAFVRVKAGGERLAEAARGPIGSLLHPWETDWSAVRLLVELCHAELVSPRH